MSVKDAVVDRFQKICSERQITLNELAYLSGVPPSTVYSMMAPHRREVSIVAIKKLCDGLGITLADFFDEEHFSGLEQEIQ